MNDDELRAVYAGGMRSRPVTDTAPDPDLLRRVARGEASDAERLQVLDAVMQSDELRREYDMFRALAAGSRGRTFSPPAWIGLAAAMLIAVYAGARWWHGQATEEPYRGTGSEVTLVMPAADAHMSLPVTLTWQAVRGAHQYDIEVLDAAGQPAHRVSVRDTTVTIAGPALVVGDYHWSVAARRADGTVARSGTSRFSVR